MDMIESLDYFFHIESCTWFIEFSIIRTPNQVGEFITVHILHDQIERFTVLIGLVVFDYIRVIKFRQDSYFSENQFDLVPEFLLV